MKSRFVALLVIAVVSALGLVGCGDDGAGGETPDAAAPVVIDASVDASLPPIDAAVIDAAMVDAAVDAFVAPPDAFIPPMPDADPPDAQVPTGKLRLVHASPVASAVDVYIEGSMTPLFASVAYGQATAYAFLPVASYRLVVREAGAPVSNAPLYTSEPIDVTVNSSITTIAAGLLGSMAPASQFRISAIVDQFAPAQPGKARLRVVHDSYSVPTVSVDVGDDGSLEQAALERFATSDAAGFEVAAGAELGLGVVGVDAQHTRIGNFVVPPAIIADGGEVYAVLTGLSNVRPRDPRGLVLLLVSTHSVELTIRQNPTIYVLAASPDAAGLDAFLGPGKVVENLAFGKLGTRRVPPTTSGHTLVFQATSSDTMPSGTPLASLSSGPLAAGEQYLVVLSGLVAPTGSDDALALHVYRDELPLTLDGNGRLRVVHAALGVGMVDIGRYSIGAAPAWNDISDFASLLPAAASAPAGTAIVDGATPLPINPGVRVTGDPSAPTLRFASGSLMNTDRVFGVLAGAWTPAGTQKPPRYLLVKTGASSWTATVLSPL